MHPRSSWQPGVAIRSCFSQSSIRSCSQLTLRPLQLFTAPSLSQLTHIQLLLNSTITRVLLHFFKIQKNKLLSCVLSSIYSTSEDTNFHRYCLCNTSLPLYCLIPIDAFFFSPAFCRVSTWWCTVIFSQMERIVNT